MIRQLDVPIYNANVLFLIETTKDEFEEFIENDKNKDKLTDEEINNIISDICNIVGVSGFTMTLDKGGYIVFIRDAHEPYYSVHELYHVSDRILRQRGVEHSSDDEAYAYLIGWISNEYSYLLNEFDELNKAKE